MEETNRQGAGCTAVAGGERRERCNKQYAGMVVGERDLSTRSTG